MNERQAEKLCFVSMPFGVKKEQTTGESIDFDTVYQLIIEPAARDAGYTPMRADNTLPSGSILEQVIQAVTESELFIGDLTFNNPNVLYEVGVRHAAQKPTLLIRRTGSGIPFDLAGYRVGNYSDSPEDIEKSRHDLYNLIKSLERAGPHAGSPVSAYVATRKLADRQEEDVGSPRNNAILDVLSGISARLQGIEDKVSGLADLENDKRPQAQTSTKGSEPNSKRIFIVHGRGEAADSLRNQLVTFLTKLQFEPVVLSEQYEGGRALPNKLDDEMADVGFAFVLLTPDDVGAHKSERDSLQPRARQNVIYEHGLFVGRLGLSRMCVLQMGKLEIPSDLSGIITKTLNEGEQLIRLQLELIKELRGAGYQVDANLLFS